MINHIVHRYLLRSSRFQYFPSHKQTHPQKQKVAQLLSLSPLLKRKFSSGQPDLLESPLLRIYTLPCFVKCKTLLHVNVFIFVLPYLDSLILFVCFLISGWYPEGGSLHQSQSAASTQPMGTQEPDLKKRLCWFKGSVSKLCGGHLAHSCLVGLLVVCVHSGVQKSLVYPNNQNTFLHSKNTINISKQ